MNATLQLWRKNRVKIPVSRLYSEGFFDFPKLQQSFTELQCNFGGVSKVAKLHQSCTRVAVHKKGS